MIKMIWVYSISKILSFQCVTTDGPSVVCPKEFSNICVPAGKNVQQPTADICGCNDPTTFCNDGKVCKQDNGAFDCRDCTTGDCPAYAPLCDGSNRCVCGTTPISAIDTAIHNTCTTEDATGVFSCGKPGKGTGDSCISASLNPRCLNDLMTLVLGDETSTCKVNLQFFCIDTKWIQIIMQFWYIK